MLLSPGMEVRMIRSSAFQNPRLWSNGSGEFCWKSIIGIQVVKFRLSQERRSSFGLEYSILPLIF
jgi:hypothetical protein